MIEVRMLFIYICVCIISASMGCCIGVSVGYFIGRYIKKIVIRTED